MASWERSTASRPLRLDTTRCLGRRSTIAVVLGQKGLPMRRPGDELHAAVSWRYGDSQIMRQWLHVETV